MIAYVDMTEFTERCAHALALVSQALIPCAPCERNLIFASSCQSAHTIGPAILLITHTMTGISKKAVIGVTNFVHLHIADCKGDTEAARRDIADALVNLFSSRDEQGQQVRAQLVHALEHGQRSEQT